MADFGKTVEMPMGMVMLMAENPAAMSAFGTLSETERAKFINRAKKARTRDEMMKIVGEITTYG
ncbi:MAG: hypothetical protein E7578_04405 [Ruminococcaceae bacterium]|nr:hypothetical protein [Oscillospiraceae bacterium]